MRYIGILAISSLILIGPGHAEAASRDAVRANNFGGELVKQDKLDDALVQFQQAVTLDPSFAAAQLNLAFTYDRLNRTDEAIRAYQKAIELDPKNGTASNNLGILYEKKGLYDEAIAAIEQALRSDPATPNAAENLENVKKNKASLAERDARIAAAKKQVEAQPKDPGAAYNLGRAYASCGENDEAFHWLTQALEFGYNDFRFLRDDPALAGLKTDPRFAELLRGR